ncbi:minor capsid protein, partial [Nitrosomonas communis]|uniref:minor capsid protein n=1 Tax=Nitrosomonas communis TaxID=44574 RepID=UPI0026EBAEA8
MATASAELIEIATRHAVHYEKLKSHEVKSFDNFLKLLNEDLIKQLSRSDITLFTRARLEKQLDLVREIIKEIYQDYHSEWKTNLVEVGKYEAEFEKKALDRVVINREFILPTEGQIAAAVFTRPLSVNGIDGGALLDQFFEQLPDNTIRRVEGAIRLGFAQGQTTQQVINRIRGTAKAKFSDGLMALSKRDADIITRTALQHVSSQSRQATWERNSDIIKGVRWVSTLDSRTSQTCRSLSGRIFPMDKGPRPPAHINCLPGDAYITASGDITGV